MKKIYLVFLGLGIVLTAVLLFFVTTAKKPAIVVSKKQIDGALLAQVNDWKIGLDDFNKRLKALEPLAEQQKLDIADVEFKKKALDELVKTVLLSEEAKTRGVDKKRDIIEAIESYKQTLLAESLLADVLKEIDVTDVEIDNFYNQNKDYFKKPEQVKIREIAVNDKNTADNLYIRILQGEDFSLIAAQSSTADSKNKGGDLGYLGYNPDEKFKKFWEVAFTLDKGEISNIFKSEDGKFYIIKAEDKIEGKITPLEEIKEDIKKALVIDKETKALEELVSLIKQKAKVIINEDLLK